MPEFIRWAGRVQYFLNRATTQSRVALYYPYEEFCADYLPDPNYTLNYDDAARIESATARAYHLELGRLMNELIRRGIDFDLVPRRLLDTVRDRILVAPYQAQPEFAGTVLRQGDLSAEDCIARLDEMLGRRVRVTGDGAAPHPLPVSECISDPYMHEKQDDGGVWVKSFLFDGKPAVMLWNANPETFTGTCDLVEQRQWTLWTPADGREIPAGHVDTVDITLPAYSMLVVLAE
jgi:hypothetical protein